LPANQLNLSASQEVKVSWVQSGALEEFKELEVEGLGTLEKVESKAKTVIQFTVDACFKLCQAY